MKIVFLGTSAMQPTKERNLSAIFVSHGSENILIDCGEGTQRQMKIANIKPTKLTKILISHFHGDHINGLPGLLHYLKANEFNGKLDIYGPKGIKDIFEHMVKFTGFRNELNINLHELKDGLFFENEDLKLEAAKLNHTATCFGFNVIGAGKIKMNMEYLKKIGLTRHPLLGKLQKGENIEWEGKKIKVKDATYTQNGKKASFICDTKYDNSCVKLAKGADVLISEATFSDENKDKADEYKHLTAGQAAMIAKKANAKKLILTHFSQRYKDPTELKNEAKKIFNNVECAEDFMEINV